MKLLIGSGITAKDGYKRVDFDKTVKPDYVLNVEKEAWPFKANSVDKILAENVLEHIWELDFFMEQAYRVLKPKGEMEILVPYYTSHHAYSDPDHIRYFTEHTFVHWDRGAKGSDGRQLVRCNADFKTKKIIKLVSPATAGRFGQINPGSLEAENYWNIWDFIRVTMTPVKPIRKGTVRSYGGKN